MEKIQDKKVSIIIPVYNVQNYIKQSLDSVKNQTYRNFEAICINDGSTDNSLEIIEEYVKQDSRFIVVSQENQGVSAARNNGIELAKGEYIMFLDPDDWLEDNAVEKAINTIMKKNADVVVFGYSEYRDSKITPDEKYLKELNNCAKNNCLIESAKIFYCVWDKIYKKDFIESKNIRFSIGIHPAEDTLFAMKCFSYKPQIVYLIEPLYVYRIGRYGSAMTKKKLLNNSIKAFEILISSDFYKNADKEYKMTTANILLGGILYHYKNNHSLKAHFEEYIDLVKFSKKLRNSSSIEILKECENYYRIQKQTSFLHILEKIFSVQHNKNKGRIIINILWFKISI